jgi:LysM repeat protein
MQFLKKTISCVLAFLFFSVALLAQKKIIVEGSKDEAYFNYTVRTGESLSSISKAFKTDVPTMMRLNNFNNKSKLVFGKPIKVPFSPTVLTQDEKQPTAVVHKVARGENLYRISMNHNKVDMELLKKWNKLPANAMVDEGQEIIVGYVNFKNLVATDVAKNEQPKVKDEPAVTKQKDVKAEEVYILKQEEKKDESKKEEPKKEEEKKETVKNEESKKEEPKTEPRVKQVVQKEEAKQEVDLQNVSAEGAFAKAFGKNVEGRSLETRTGTAMTFKSASGWTDKKYYILINDVPPGSIVKVSNGGSKFVYAKVLWGLGGIKENEGLEFRISNSAAAMLGISDPKFPLIVTFYE